MTSHVDRRRTAGRRCPGRRHPKMFLPRKDWPRPLREWTEDASVRFVKTSVLELLARIGLILPRVDIAPVLGQ